MTAALAARAALERDGAQLIYILSRVALCALHQVAAGLLVHAVITLLPAPAHRRLRLALAAPPLAVLLVTAVARVDARVSTPGRLLATIFAGFNAPLRAAHLLLSPPPPKPPAARALPPAALCALLVAVPACPSLPNSAPRRGPLPPPSDARAALARGLRRFAALVIFAAAVPATAVAPTPVLLPFLTVLLSSCVIVMAAVFAMVTGVSGGEAFSWPWLSPSLGQFWAFRWNAPIADALRGAVYAPLVTYAGASEAAAVLATFVVSGAGHVAMLASVGVRDVGALSRWQAFFTVQWAGVLAERKLGLRGAPRRAVALVFFLVTAHFWFCIPFAESDAFENIMWELGLGARFLRNTATVSFCSFSGHIN